MAKDRAIRGHEIGSLIWSAGSEIEILTAPYLLHGGWFQDGRDTGTGETLTVMTPEEWANRTESNRRDWHRQQDAFRRLRER